MSRDDADSVTRQVGRFSLSGVVNTVLGYGVIFGSQGMGASPYLANVMGYAVGLVSAFVLSRRFVFSASGDAGQQTMRFLIAFACAYLINFGVLHFCIWLSLHPVVAQIISGGFYLIVMFLLSQRWVFANAVD
ncbi:MAG: GtrA family protein [Gammaproteobacteria bacterium]|nr:GtrA family protein [Gammaproteobacteria bacterium]MCP5136951.1 GtrA family protein [Gammaproteobacteria bacterium]